MCCVAPGERACCLKAVPAFVSHTTSYSPLEELTQVLAPQDPLIVYTSNIFAILGLRSLYTVLANAMMDLPYLKPSVAVILGFVGAKLGAEYFGYEIPNLASLGIICSLLGAGVGASLWLREQPAD
jgi:predicted tellurium resistance membrane protein TerC